jgi:phosphoribosylformylglycinamidine cyclo-ligase
MAVVVAEADAEKAAQLLRAAGETVYRIGRIEQGSGEPDAVVA